MDSSHHQEFAPVHEIMEPAYFHPMCEYIDQYEDDVCPVTKQPMHRYLYGLDPASLCTVLLPGDIPSIKLPSIHGQMQYERPFPAFNVWTALSRHASPDTTSTTDTSGYAPLQECYSPPPQSCYPALGSTDDFLLHTIPFPTPAYVHEGAYPAELPLSDRGMINPREVLYHQENEPDMEDNEQAIDTATPYEYKNDTTYVKQEASVPIATQEDCKPYQHSVMYAALPVAEEVQPVPKAEESDSDYTPSIRSPKRLRGKKSTASRSTANSGGRKFSNGYASVSLSTTHRVTKRLPRLTTTRGNPRTASSPYPSAKNCAVRRPFPCPLAGYGCTSDFASKNEWKRHFSTQHLKLGFWRCDMCPPSVDPHDTTTLYHNDFNRKDLFTQHLRRMHFARPGLSPTSTSSNTSPSLGPSPISLPPRQRLSYRSHYRASPHTTLVTEETLPEVQTRCYIKLRDTPMRSSCLFCDDVFDSWEERMEHVGRHLEKDKGVAGVKLEPATWNLERDLEAWFEREGLIERVAEGSAEWRIGDGRPRRRNMDLGEE